MKNLQTKTNSLSGGIQKMSGTSKIMEKTKNPMNIRFLNIFTKFRTQKEKKRKIQKYKFLINNTKQPSFFCTRWAPPSYKWSCNPYEWPYKWVTGVITPLMGVITPLITGRGPPCRNFGEFFCGMTGHGSHGEKFSLPPLSRGSLVLKASHLGVFSNQGMMVRCEKDGGWVF